MKNLSYSKISFSVSGKIIFVVFCSLFLSLQIFAVPGRLDLKFPQVLANGASVRAIEIQPDGKILIAGEFSTRGAILRQDVARLNADGSLDPTFNIGSGANNGEISVMKLQSDGKILIGGFFNNINGVFVSPVARLNTDGSLDTTFNLAGINVTFAFDLDIQADGKILISAMNSIGTSFVARLNVNGGWDSSFNFPFYGAGNNSFKVAFAPSENKIYVGGNFSSTVNQIEYRGLARLNLNGTVDTSFAITVNYSQFGLIVDVEPLPNGKLLVWGKFDTVNGVTRRNLAIINSNGSLDTSFNPATRGTEIILSVAVQSDRKIIVGGSNFTSNTFLRGNIARLNADGTVDTTFNQGRGANAAVRTVKIQGNNKLLIGGDFFRYNSFPRRALAQINL